MRGSESNEEYYCRLSAEYFEEQNASQDQSIVHIFWWKKKITPGKNQARF